MSTGFSIPFVKASACGNDFLVIDGEHAKAHPAELTRKLCDRHQGIGADGVEWLYPDAIAATYARLFNADGSEAEISGNGTRCVAAYLFSEATRLSEPSDPSESNVSASAAREISIRTGAGVKTCVLKANSGMQYEFETDMGTPRVSGEVALRVASRDVRAISSSMGNPHLSVFVDEFCEDWQGEAAEIARCANMSSGVNVEMVKLIDINNIEVRFFERGVGETQSSGTGSCAAAVASIFTKRAVSPVRVLAQGGTQTVRWDGNVFLSGPAQIVAQGEFFLPESL